MLVQIVSFLQGHEAAISIVVVAVLDFLVEINPHLESNTIISLLLAFFKKKPPAPPAVPPAA